MALSSSAVIHFTQSKKALEGILSDNFRLSYCKEKIVLENKLLEFLVPMVSFCDIPLSQIKEHIDNYGSYGIGLTKEWAERKKLNPVLYVEKNSFLSASIRKILLEYLKNTQKTLQTFDEKEKAILDVIRYMKNYQDDLIRGDKTIPNYRFSDEREWRYVLNYLELEQPLHSAQEDKSILNSKISEKRLEFEPNDIKYVIIDNENEISDFLQILRNAKGKNYTHSDVERLMTRIITTEQIRKDF